MPLGINALTLSSVLSRRASTLFRRGPFIANSPLSAFDSDPAQHAGSPAQRTVCCRRGAPSSPSPFPSLDLADLALPPHPPLLAPLSLPRPPSCVLLQLAVRSAVHRHTRPAEEDAHARPRGPQVAHPRRAHREQHRQDVARPARPRQDHDLARRRHHRHQRRRHHHGPDAGRAPDRKAPRRALQVAGRRDRRRHDGRCRCVPRSLLCASSSLFSAAHTDSRPSPCAQSSPVRSSSRRRPSSTAASTRSRSPTASTRRAASPSQSSTASPTRSLTRRARRASSSRLPRRAWAARCASTPSSFTPPW